MIPLESISNRSINQANVIYKYAGDDFINENGTLNYELMRKDNIHLAPGGYYKWAELIQPEINKVFGE